jgi:hypothetical protein
MRKPKMKKRKPSALLLFYKRFRPGLLRLILLLCFFPWEGTLPDICRVLPVARASSDEPGSSQDEPPEKKGRIDSLHDTVSTKVNASAVWLDTFFDDERVVEEENTSSLRLIGTMSKEKDDSVEYDTKFRLKIILPYTQKRLKLVISGNGEDELDPENTPEDNIRENFEQRDEENVSLALWYSFLTTKRQNLTFNVGFRLRRASPVIYAGPRYRYLFMYGTWNIRFIETIRYYTDEGWESETSVDFERTVLENFLFRTNVGGSWFEGINGYFYHVNFFLYQPIGTESAFVYEWSNSMQTRPNHQFSEIVLQISYRQRIWRDWLFIETAPYISFSREQDFDTIPGIYLRLEAIFGKLPEF